MRWILSISKSPIVNGRTCFLFSCITPCNMNSSFFFTFVWIANTTPCILSLYNCFSISFARYLVRKVNRVYRRIFCRFAGSSSTWAADAFGAESCTNLKNNKFCETLLHVHARKTMEVLSSQKLVCFGLKRGLPLEKLFVSEVVFVNFWKRSLLTVLAQKVWGCCSIFCSVSSWKLSCFVVINVILIHPSRILHLGCVVRRSKEFLLVVVSCQPVPHASNFRESAGQVTHSKRYLQAAPNLAVNLLLLMLRANLHGFQNGATIHVHVRDWASVIF